MASVSISHMIIFIASIVIAAGVVGTMTTGVDRVSSAMQEGSIDASDQLRTDVAIISDAGSSVYDADNETVTLLVKNVGTHRLPPDGGGLDFIFDGSFVHPDDVEADLLTGTGDSWARGDVLELTITVGPLDAGDYRLKLTVNGDEEVFEFRHGS